MVLDDPVRTAARLVAAIQDGDLDTVDALAASLLPTLSPHEAAGLLAGSVVTSLAAAGHAPIGFAAGGSGAARRCRPRCCGVRCAASLLDRSGSCTGIRCTDLATNGDAGRLYDALRSAPRLGRPGSDFIHPLMSQVQDSGLAARLLAPVLADRFDVAAATRTLTRVAAWSMIHDDSAQAPYGWSHALTMPQGVMALAGAGVPPRTALAVAATFTLGFRAAHGIVDLPASISPGGPPAATCRRTGHRRGVARGRPPGEVHAGLPACGRRRSAVPVAVPECRCTPCDLVERLTDLRMATISGLGCSARGRGAIREIMRAASIAIRLGCVAIVAGVLVAAQPDFGATAPPAPLPYVAPADAVAPATRTSGPQPDRRLSAGGVPGGSAPPGYVAGGRGAHVDARRRPRPRCRSRSTRSTGGPAAPRWRPASDETACARSNNGAAATAPRRRACSRSAG